MVITKQSDRAKQSIIVSSIILLASCGSDSPSEPKFNPESQVQHNINKMIVVDNKVKLKDQV